MESGSSTSFQETRNADYLAYCIKWADWLFDGIPKTEMGGIQHITIDSDNTQQMWADTVFMAVSFWGRWQA